MLNRRLSQEAALTSLHSLVAEFSRVVTRCVEHWKGRIDQQWGNGALAVFGEYVDAKGDPAKISNMRALGCARALVTELRDVFDTWLRVVFGLREFREGNDQYVHLEPVVVCTFGEVRFDYVGGLEHPVYMAVGDRITFAKQLSAVAATAAFHHSEPVPADLMREVLRFGLARDRRDYREAPILISQSAYEWVSDLVKPSTNGPGQTVDEPHYVKLPARSAVYPVHALWPENIQVV